MRRAGKWISIVAVLGMLLHAGLVVRHGMSRLATTFLEYELQASLGASCHTAASGTEIGDQQLPVAPGAPDNSQSCPICLGLCGAVAVAPSAPMTIAVVWTRTSERIRSLAPVIAERMADARPPVRGPPQLG